MDPYYLTYKAESIGYHPQVILAGRRINDGMGAYVASQTVKRMIKKGQKIEGAKVLVLGITFKENCPDIRNSRVIDIIRELQEFGCAVTVCDPWADAQEVAHEYGAIDFRNAPESLEGDYGALIAAVGHQELKTLNPRALMAPNGVVFDVKGIFDKAAVDTRL